VLQPTLLPLPDVGLYTLGVPLLCFVQLGETLGVTLFIGGKVTSQSQKMVDLWNEFPRDLRLQLAMAVW
jgi:hypothetical protein